MANDIAKLLDKRAKVYVGDEALRERGIESGELIEGLDFIPRGHIAKLFAGYDQIWHW